MGRVSISTIQPDSNSPVPKPSDKRRVYKPEPTPLMFHMDDSFVRGMMGPYGSGKSVACCMEIVRRGQTQKAFDGIRKSRWVVIRNTFRELETTTIKTWQEWVPPHITKMRWTPPPTCTIQTKLPDGTQMDLEVIFLAVEQPDDIKKLLSLELTAAWVNEAREIPKSVFDALTARVGRYPPEVDGGPSWSGIIMDTNPPDTDHWWYRAAEIERPDGWRFWKQPGALMYDSDGGYKFNPDAENVQHQPLKEQYWLRQVAGKDREWIKVYLMGQYGNVFTGRPVYEGAYSDDLHVAARPLLPTLQKGIPVWLGWDFGLSPACVVCQVTDMGQLRIIKEFWCEDGGLRQFVELAVKPFLLNHCNGMKILSVGDPAGKAHSQADSEVTCFSTLRQLGIPTDEAPTNDFGPRREAVMEWLNRRVGEEPAFLLDPSCDILRKGFQGGYQFGRVAIAGAEERYRDMPVKNKFSHLHDALQYVCSALKVGVSDGRAVKAWPERRGWAL